MDDPRLGSVVDERYQIHERLAAGGMGVVYRGERVGIAKPVAIKFLHRNSAMMPERLERFHREATAMSRLAHPNLMSIIDFGEADGVPYLVMEYHAGMSLRETLERGALEPRRAVYIAYQILAGLSSAHASGVLHRDLKPSNVLLVGAPGEDLVKILDFGVAKLLDTGKGPTELSAVAGRMLGTPEYMAPEQARTQAVDPRTDVYAVGVILYQMVVGRRPFEGENDLAVLRQQLEDPPVPPRALRAEISAELDAAILRAIAKDPDERWSSAQEFASALLALPEGSSVLRLRADRAEAPAAEPGEPGEPGEPAPAPRTNRSRRRFAIASVLLLGTALGAVLAASYVGSGMPWQSPAPPDAAPDAAPPDAAPPDAPPPDAAPPPLRAELKPYVTFLRQSQTAPVDYVMGLFDEHDAVVLCMRSPAESTQYQLVAELVRDPRFSQRVGDVITDTGTTELRETVAELVRGDSISDEQLVPVYRALEDERPNPNYGQLLRAVQATNVALSPEHHIMVHPSGNRIVRTVRRVDTDSGVLVLLHECRASRAFPDDVARVLLNQMRDYVPLADGKWDAAFERAGNRSVGFDLGGSPFGADEVGTVPDDLEGAIYEELFTGFVFHEPLSGHRLVAAAADRTDEDLAAPPDEPGPGADERATDAGGVDLDAGGAGLDAGGADLEPDRALTYADLAPARWAEAQQQIETWLEPAPVEPPDASLDAAAP